MGPCPTGNVSCGDVEVTPPLLWSANLHTARWAQVAGRSGYLEPKAGGAFHYFNQPLTVLDSQTPNFRLRFNLLRYVNCENQNPFSGWFQDLYHVATD